MIADRARVRLLVVALLAWLVAPGVVVAGLNCAGGGSPRPDEGGVGGTGVHADRPDDEGGIGGTGVQANRPDEGGIGGTGIGAATDTGVIGTIAGFGSICVGTTEIRYGTDTAIEIDGQQAGAAALAVGQVVEIVAHGSVPQLRAQRISVQYIVSGPVTGVDSGGGWIEVLRQRVQLSQATRLDLVSNGELVAASKLTPAAWVRVSGMRRADGVIVASRLSAAEPDERVRLSGRVSRTDGGELEVAGVPVRSAARLTLGLSDEVRVVGRWVGQVIAADSVEAVAAIPFSGRAARLDIEGYARAAATSGGIYLGPFLVEVPKDVAASSASFLKDQDIRLHVQAIVRGQHVVAERVAPAADLPLAPERQPGRSHVPGSGGGSREDKQGHGGEGAGHHGPQVQGGPEPGVDRGDPGPGDMSPPHGGGMPPRPDVAVPPGPGAADQPMMEHYGMPDGSQRPEPPPRPERPEPPPRPERPMRPDMPAHHDMMPHGR